MEMKLKIRADFLATGFFQKQKSHLWRFPL